MAEGPDSKSGSCAFESREGHAPVAQLAEAAVSGTVGWGFESLQEYYRPNPPAGPPITGLRREWESTADRTGSGRGGDERISKSLFGKCRFHEFAPSPEILGTAVLLPGNVFRASHRSRFRGDSAAGTASVPGRARCRSLVERELRPALLLLPECRPYPYAAICRAMTMDRRRGQRDGSEHAVQRWRAMSEPGAIPARRSCFDPIMEMHIPIS